jgi:two-component sensor histidine kinase
LTEDAEVKAQPTRLDNLLDKILSPYLDASQATERHRLVASGPTIVIGTRAVTTLALILHEFATNAVKYGALSVPEGSLKIQWAVRDDVLALTWEEHGGPALAGPPTAKGFGTLLSGHSIRSQLGGNLSHHWNPGGLVIELSCPLDGLRE